jgi:predicted HicB family RNase H-like nuclease
MVKNKAASAPGLDKTSGETEEKHHAAPRKKVGRPREIHYSLEKKFTLMLPKEIHRSLKIKSAELEKPMTTMIIDAIKEAYKI